MNNNYINQNVNHHIINILIVNMHFHDINDLIV